MFFSQLEEFCQIVQEEFLARFDQITDVPISARAAVGFTESLLLCPTVEAARSSVHKDLTGALSFVLAVQGIQQRIERGGFELPADPPEYQTRFYFLGCAVQEYLDSLPTQPQDESAKSFGR
jgi:hypothetical protein